MAALEALLFAAAGPVGVPQLAEALGSSNGETEHGLQALAGQYAQRGLRLQWHGGRVQLTTAPEMASVVERFLGLEAMARLSRAAVETLAIIAYRQPITRPGIDAVRGVNSDGVLRSLLMKGLVQEMGRAEGPGRPILYATTVDFLQHFGLSSLDEMPHYEVETDSEPENHILKD
jgi:segregation and condensation protein B